MSHCGANWLSDVTEICSVLSKVNVNSIVALKIFEMAEACVKVVA